MTNSLYKMSLLHYTSSTSHIFLHTCKLNSQQRGASVVFRSKLQARYHDTNISASLERTSFQLYKLLTICPKWYNYKHK